MEFPPHSSVLSRENVKLVSSHLITSDGPVSGVHRVEVIAANRGPIFLEIKAPDQSRTNYTLRWENTNPDGNHSFLIFNPSPCHLWLKNDDSSNPILIKRINVVLMAACSGRFTAPWPQLPSQPEIIRFHFSGYNDHYQNHINQNGRNWNSFLQYVLRHTSILDLQASVPPFHIQDINHPRFR